MLFHKASKLKICGKQFVLFIYKHICIYVHIFICVKLHQNYFKAELFSRLIIIFYIADSYQSGLMISAGNLFRFFFFFSLENKRVYFESQTQLLHDVLNENFADLGVPKQITQLVMSFVDTPGSMHLHYLQKATPENFMRFYGRHTYFLLWLLNNGNYILLLLCTYLFLRIWYHYYSQLPRDILIAINQKPPPFLQILPQKWMSDPLLKLLILWTILEWIENLLSLHLKSGVQKYYNKLVMLRHFANEDNGMQLIQQNIGDTKY
ncbi:hypothetical protein RFI_40241, partial [Reticulomyxa filosa]